MIHESGLIHMAISRVLEGLYKNGKVYRKKGRARELLAKGKKGLFEARTSFLGKGKQGFYHADYLFFLWGMEKAQLMLSHWCWPENSKLVD